MPSPNLRPRRAQVLGNTQLVSLVALVALAAVLSIFQLGQGLAHNIGERAGADHVARSVLARSVLDGRGGAGAASTSGSPSLVSRSAAAVSGAASKAARLAEHAAQAAAALELPSWQGRAAYTLATAPRFADAANDGVPTNLRARGMSAFQLQAAIEQLLPQEQRVLQVSAGSERPLTLHALRTEFQGRTDRFGNILTLNNQNPRALALSPEIEGDFTYVGVKRGIMIGCCGPSGGVCCGVPANPEDFSTFLGSIQSRLAPGGVAMLQGAIEQPFLLNASRKLHVDAAARFANDHPNTTTFVLSEGIDTGLAIVNAPSNKIPDLAEIESSAYLRYFLDLGAGF